MALFTTFKCLKCEWVFEGIVDICSHCGSRAAKVGGIEQCLRSGRPPGYAGGVTTKYSARAYDRILEHNFKLMRISNCTHKDGKPVCTFQKPQGSYNNLPGWAGNQGGPIRAYQSLEAMRRESGFAPQLTYDGKPFEVPQVHPTASPGTMISPGARANNYLRANTIMVAKERKD